MLWHMKSNSCVTQPLQTTWLQPKQTEKTLTKGYFSKPLPITVWNTRYLWLWRVYENSAVPFLREQNHPTAAKHTYRHSKVCLVLDFKIPSALVKQACKVVQYSNLQWREYNTLNFAHKWTQWHQKLSSRLIAAILSKFNYRIEIVKQLLR